MFSPLSKINKVKAAGIPSYVELEEDEKEGYVVATTFTFTKNIDIDKAIKELKPYLLFKDGEPCKEEYSITPEIDKEKRQMKCKITLPDGKTETHYSTYTLLESSLCEYACATPFHFFRYAVVIDKDSVNRNVDINAIPVEVFKNRFNAFILPEFDLNYNDSLLETNNIWSKSFIRHGNLTYHEARANARIIKGLTVPSYKPAKINNDEYNELTINPDEKPNNENGINKFTNNTVVQSIFAGVLTTIITYLIFVIVRSLLKTMKRRS